MCSCSHYNGLFLRHKIPPNTRLCSWSWQKLTKMEEKWPLWLQLTHSLVSKTPRLIIAQNKSFLAQISMIIGPGLLHMALSASEVLWQSLSCLLIITGVQWLCPVVSDDLYWCPLVSIGVHWCSGDISSVGDKPRTMLIVWQSSRSWSIFRNLSDESLSGGGGPFVPRPAGKSTEMGAVIIAAAHLPLKWRAQMPNMKLCN